MSKRRPRQTELALPEGHPLAVEVQDALVRARAEVLVDLYDGWQRLRIARAGAAAERAHEAVRLEQRASYMLRSIQTARELPMPRLDVKALSKQRGVSGAGEQRAFRDALAEAHRDLAEARALLDRRTGNEERLFAQEIESVQQRILARADAMARCLPPRLCAQARSVGPERVLVHLERPESDAALLWSLVLAGKLPTRYDAFFDDAVDDLALPPARFYAEEGEGCARPDGADAEDALALDSTRGFVPVKGMMAVAVPGHDFPRFRIINRGPLAQVEARERGGAYENLLARAAAELFTGYLIRLRVEKRLELSLALG